MAITTYKLSGRVLEELTKKGEIVSISSETRKASPYVIATSGSTDQTWTIGPSDISSIPISVMADSFASCPACGSAITISRKVDYAAQTVYTCSQCDMNYAVAEVEAQRSNKPLQELINEVHDKFNNTNTTRYKGNATIPVQKKKPRRRLEL